MKHQIYLIICIFNFIHPACYTFYLYFAMLQKQDMVSCNVKKFGFCLSWIWLLGESHSHFMPPCRFMGILSHKIEQCQFPRKECKLPQVSYRTRTSCCRVLFRLLVCSVFYRTLLGCLPPPHKPIRWGDYCLKLAIPLSVSLWKIKSATSVSRKSFFSSHRWQELHFFTRTSWCGIS